MTTATEHPVLPQVAERAGQYDYGRDWMAEDIDPSHPDSVAIRKSGVAAGGDVSYFAVVWFQGRRYKVRLASCQDCGAPTIRVVEASSWRYAATWESVTLWSALLRQSGVCQFGRDSLGHLCAECAKAYHTEYDEHGYPVGGGEGPWV